jgi:hypothetical protein
VPVTWLALLAGAVAAALAAVPVPITVLILVGLLEPVAIVGAGVLPTEEVIATSVELPVATVLDSIFPFTELPVPPEQADTTTATIIDPMTMRLSMQQTPRPPDATSATIGISADEINDVASITPIGNPAVIGSKTVRPEALRPRLSAGLPNCVDD